MVIRPTTTSPRPAILFLQGLSCDSLDPPSGPAVHVLPLIETIARSGFVTVRIDKSGVGRSSGPSCEDLDFASEVAGFRSALQALRTWPVVDSSRVFLLGWSLGGVIAPLLANDQVAGVVAYGTDALPWLDYDVSNAKRQWRMHGIPADRIEGWALRFAAFDRELLAGSDEPMQVVGRHPEFASWLDDQHHLQGRHLAYFRQLASLDQEAAWRGVKSNVLIVAGEADFTCAAQDQQAVARIVNSVAPGKARSVRIPCADHWFRHTCSMQESMADETSGQFEPAIAQVIVRWLLAQTADSGSVNTTDAQ